MFKIIENEIRDTENTLIVNEDDCKSSNNHIISTIWILSCLGITLYSPQKKIGTLAHITWRKDIKIIEDYKPENIIDTMLRKMKCNINDILLASYFWEWYWDEKKYIIVKKYLDKLNIPIIGNDIEPGFARRWFLNCNNGKIEVYRNKSIKVFN